MRHRRKAWHHRIDRGIRVSADDDGLATPRGMTEVFGCARMTLGPRPTLPWQEIFGVTTFELG